MADTDYSINPTDEQRRQLLQEALTRVGRREDFENIVELLSPPPDLVRSYTPGAMRSIRVGVIGAGLAGLAAAYELRKLGADITIFEARKDRIGGRVYTFYFDRAGRYFGEFGAMEIPASHETTWHYINLFHLDTESLNAPNSNNFIYAHDIRIRRDLRGQNVTDHLYPFYNLTETERNTPWGVLSDYAKNTVMNQLTPEQRADILRIQSEYSPEYAAATRLSNRQTYEMLGLSQGAVNLLSAVDPLASAGLNISYDGAMNTAYSLDYLNTYRIVGGTVRLPLAFYSSLTDNDPPEIDFPSYFLGKVDIRFGQPVNGIYRSKADGGVDLHYQNLRGTELTEEFDYVICAVPFSTLREMQIRPLFRNEKMQAIREYNYMDAMKTNFLCRKRFWEENLDYGRMNGGISFTDLPIQSIVYPPDHLRCESKEDCSPYDPGVLTAAHNLDQDAVRVFSQSDHRRFDLICRGVEEVHGLPQGYLNSVIDSYKTVHWNTEQWSRGAFAAGYPGQRIRFAYSMLQPEYNGRVYFAGEHASAKQAWMQGALQSGKTAANMIIQSLKLPQYR